MGVKFAATSVGCGIIGFRVAAMGVGYIAMSVGVVSRVAKRKNMVR